MLRWNSNNQAVADRAFFTGRVDGGALQIAPDPTEDRFVGIYLDADDEPVDDSPVDDKPVDAETSEDLQALIDQATGGETFVLAPGSYRVTYDTILDLRFEAAEGGISVGVR